MRIGDRHIELSLLIMHELLKLLSTRIVVEQIVVLRKGASK